MKGEKHRKSQFFEKRLKVRLYRRKTRAGWGWAAQRVLRPVTAIRKRKGTWQLLWYTLLPWPVPGQGDVGTPATGDPGGAGRQPLPCTLGRDAGLSLFGGSLLRHPLPCHPCADP